MRRTVSLAVCSLIAAQAFVGPIGSRLLAAPQHRFVERSLPRAGAAERVAEHRWKMAADADSSLASSKMLHVVYRCGDMEKSIKFYTEVLGMQVLRQRDVPDDKYSNAFVGYGTESRGEHFSIELTYNYGVSSYQLGTGFRGMTVCLPDIRGVARRARDAGTTVVSGPEDIELGPYLIPDEPVGKTHVMTVLQLEDPDGYGIEVIEQRRKDPVARVKLATVNLDKAVTFYEKALKMKLLRKQSNVPIKAQMLAVLGYAADEASGCCVELIYDYSTEKIDMGDGYGQIAVSTPDVYKAAEAITAAGEKVTRDPGPVPGIGTKITALRDPDGYKTVLVDEEDFEKELE